MRDVAIQILHLIVRLARPGGLRSVVAESVPNLHTADRVIAGLCSLLMRRARVDGELLMT